MKLKDIIDLAKSGYSVADVKELIALGETEPETKDPEQGKDPEPDEDKGPDGKDQDDTDEELTLEEYKRKYEEAAAENVKLKKAAAHIETDGSEKTDEERLLDIANNFFH